MVPNAFKATTIEGHLVLTFDGRLSLHDVKTDLKSGDSIELQDGARAPESSLSRAQALSWLLTNGMRVNTFGALKDEEPRIISGHQPSYHGYIPLFCKVAASDVFSIADDLSFGRQKFQHRQRLVTPSGTKWLTVPVCKSASRSTIRAKSPNYSTDWQTNHWQLICKAFEKLKYFDTYADYYEAVYRVQWNSLAALDEALWMAMTSELAPNTVSLCSSNLDFDKSGKKGDRIAAELSLFRGGGYYLAGAASDYLTSKSYQHQDLTYVEVIESKGFAVLKCALDEEKFRRSTATPVTAAAMELVAREGKDASAILRDSTRLSHFVTQPHHVENG